MRKVQAVNSKEYNEKKELLIKLEYIFGMLLAMALWGAMTWGYYIQHGKVLQLLIVVVVYAVFGEIGRASCRERV